MSDASFPDPVAVGSNGLPLCIGDPVYYDGGRFLVDEIDRDDRGCVLRLAPVDVRARHLLNDVRLRRGDSAPMTVRAVPADVRKIGTVGMLIE